MNRSDCIEIFKPLLDAYKKTKKAVSTEQKLAEVYTNDYLLFQKIHKTFEMLEQLLKYMVVKNEKYYAKIIADFTIADFTSADEKLQQINMLKVNVPKTTDDIIALCYTYPEAFCDFHEDLYRIVSNENYDTIWAYKSINPLLYYSVFEDIDSAHKILQFEDDIIELHAIVVEMIRKSIKPHINMLLEDARQRRKKIEKSDVKYSDIKKSDLKYSADENQHSNFEEIE